MNDNLKPFFAPQLLINNGVKDISFYTNAFDATENLQLAQILTCDCSLLDHQNNQL